MTFQFESISEFFAMGGTVSMFGSLMLLPLLQWGY